MKIGDEVVCLQDLEIVSYEADLGIFGIRIIRNNKIIDKRAKIFLPEEMIIGEVHKVFIEPERVIKWSEPYKVYFHTYHDNGVKEPCLIYLDRDFSSNGVYYLVRATSSSYPEESLYMEIKLQSLIQETRIAKMLPPQEALDKLHTLVPWRYLQGMIVSIFIEPFFHDYGRLGQTIDVKDTDFIGIHNMLSNDNGIIMVSFVNRDNFILTLPFYLLKSMT